MKRGEKPEMDEALDILKRNNIAKFTTEDNSEKIYMCRVNFSHSFVDGKLKIVLDFKNQMVGFYKHQQNIEETRGFDFVIAEHKTIGNTSNFVYRTLYIKKGLVKIEKSQIVINVDVVTLRQMTGQRSEIRF